MQDAHHEPAAQDAAPYDFTQQVGYLLRRAYQRHLAIFQAESADGQLTAVQFSTLCALRDNGALSQGELVRHTGIDQATIRGIVDRLRGRSLVALSKDPEDGRKVITGITPAGLALLDEMVPRARRITELTMERLNPAERMALIHTLRILADVDAAP
ncbi:MarR family winged helix-turn-helix transcriptional regulator [Aureimonas phyllosphaerae]|uniref:DNA-binding MarR family transcriptional regulator n=1 Tax=Aureimonas phyllosphaerae TaxID=1166078 RepID=A0A7W6C205_9HYPH|nr:MarR family transcriptional regulator [Aureimonas phyllosphaerae]MBB3937017.1 DNA-binding MarR family transcriptional regulator [Aureimonas phyllosphaerae]MBB3960868.1 DNA-binding MarR family transcriptional regulator [Aureimonas phyllosphaerae]SFF51729.1 transcriptional regulator, MarR family [Aureimonas phyllosphaerae]